MQTKNISVVNLANCRQVSGSREPFLLVLERGQSLIETITKCAENCKIASVTLAGIGAVQNPELGYYDLATKSYQNKIFHGEYELIALNGNITRFNGQYIVHLHVALSDANFQVIAGHLQSAVVSITAEITFIPFAQPIFRKLDKEFNLKLITPHNKTKEQEALEYFHCEGANYNCAQAILKAFQQESNIPDELIEEFRKFGGGKAKDNLCGALFAALELCKQHPEKQELIKHEFAKVAGSIKCKEILKSKKFACKECVKLAARLLEQL